MVETGSQMTASTAKGFSRSEMPRGSRFAETMRAFKGFFAKQNACVSHTKGVMRASVRNAENAKCLCGSHFAEMKRALKQRREHFIFLKSLPASAIIQQNQHPLEPINAAII